MKVFTIQNNLKDCGIDMPIETWKQCIADIQHKIHNGWIIAGELDHDATSYTTMLSNISHIMEDVKTDDDFNYEVKIRTITSKGYDENGIMSTKGDLLCNVLTSGIQVVAKPRLIDNEIITFDIEKSWR